MKFLSRSLRLCDHVRRDGEIDSVVLTLCVDEDTPTSGPDDKAIQEEKQDFCPSLFHKDEKA